MLNHNKYTFCIESAFAFFNVLRDKTPNQISIRHLIQPVCRNGRSAGARSPAMFVQPRIVTIAGAVYPK